MSKTILSILNEIAANPSTKAKEAILKREEKNTVLRKVFAAAYDPTISYYIKKIPSYVPAARTQSTLSDAIEYLSLFSSRKMTGNNAIDALTKLLNDLTADDATVISRIIDRDLRCNCSDSIASRVWPGLVPTFDVMLSHKDISGIKFPAYAQIKSDGARCHIILRSGQAMAFSRNGKPIELHGCFDEDMIQMVHEGETLDGELLAFRNGEILDRKTGNGIVNKAVKGTISKEEAEMLIFVCWDIVDFTSTVPYNKRIERLTKVEMNRQPKSIRVLQTSIVNNEAEAQAFFEQCIAEGEEGAMIKNMNAVWVPKRTKDLGKMKAEEVADLVVVGLEEGAGKYAGKLGALVCETSDGELQVNVGTGFSDADRKEYWTKDMIGKVVEVCYNQVISSKGKDKKSLFLPRIVGVRFDKTVANKLEELK